MIFRTIFNIIGRLPLIDPDGGYEADLLLRGTKPIGLFVDYVTPPDVIEDHSPIMEEIRTDIGRLDTAVRQGILRKHQFIVRNQHHSIWNLYCQAGCEGEMAELAELLLSGAERRPLRFAVPRDYGEYFGYGRGDIRLFAQGGYDSLPIGIRSVFKMTHRFRQRCRIAGRLDQKLSELDL